MSDETGSDEDIEASGAFNDHVKFLSITERMSAAEARDFLSLVLHSIPDVVFIKDAKFRHIQGNAAFFDLFPEDMRQSVLGSTGAEEIAPQDVEAFQAKDREAFETGHSETTEIVTVAGQDPRRYHTKKIRFQTKDGTPYLLALARDVTAAHKAEEQLRSAVTFQDLMLDHIPDMVFVKDENFKIVKANENFLNVYPSDMRATVIGSTTIEQYDEEEREQFLRQDRIAFEAGFSETEEDITFPDGQRRVLFTKKARFENEDGEPFVLGIGRDITELVEARKDNELSIALLNTVFETVTGAIIGLDNDKQVLMINNAARQMLGGKSTETPFAWPDDIEFLDPADMQPLESSHDPIARALIGHAIGGEVHLMTRRSSSESRYVRVTSSEVKSASTALRTVIVLDDVSEAERNRQHIERQSRLDALGQLTGGIAHDFNNLLNTMQYALELIRRDDLSERSQRSVAAALKSITRGSDLTNRLLAFAKKQPSRAAAHSLREVLSDVRELVGPAIEASLAVEFAEADEDYLVFCDSGQLQNAILNLILNSRDAIMQHNKGNLIRIDSRAVDALPTERTKESGQQSGELEEYPEVPDGDAKAGHSRRYIEISVSDNGPGMTKAVASRALDPFFTTKGVNSGTGLGLSMVYGFVQQANGDLRIYTEEGEGTAVKLYLPRGSRDIGLEKLTELDPLTLGSGETIMLVEDEEYLLEQMAELLKELNYNVLRIPNGRAALAVLGDGARPDLILTDVVMPGGIGGFELARNAREIIPDIPIIYMSGYTGFTDEEMGDVIAPLLPKPSSPTMTSKQIRSVLDRTKK